jgi:CubicO group peptidase (beta-lactamase class C family)
MTHAGFDQTTLDRLHARLQEAVDGGEMGGAVIALQRDGVPVIDTIGYRDLAQRLPMTAGTIFHIASMTKAVTAVATLQLRDEGRFTLDDPVGRWLPELAAPRVLRAPDGLLDDTVPVERPITVRDLLRLTLGTGIVLAPPGSTPIQRAIDEAGVAPGFLPSIPDSDTWITRLGALPLIHQPGADWMYHTGAEVLGVLIERVTGQPLGDVLDARILRPLDMVDTGFSVPESKLNRLATAYRVDASGTLVVMDPEFARKMLPPRAPRPGMSELVSTARDFLRFGQMLLDGGTLDGNRILAETSVREMTTDQVTAREKAAWPGFRAFLGDEGWGYGVSVLTAMDTFGRSAGSYGWSGGLNTHWHNDTARRFVGLLLFQREITGPEPGGVVDDFWRLAYRALDGPLS